MRAHARALPAHFWCTGIVRSPWLEAEAVGKSVSASRMYANQSAQGRSPDSTEPFPHADARIGISRLKLARARAGHDLCLTQVIFTPRRRTASSGAAGSRLENATHCQTKQQVAKPRAVTAPLMWGTRARRFLRPTSAEGDAVSDADLLRRSAARFRSCLIRSRS